MSAFHCPFEALGKAALVRPRVVITDFQMPAIDGVTVADRIVVMSSLTKVIIYTGIPELVCELTRKHLVLGKGQSDSLHRLLHLVESELRIITAVL